MKTSETLLDLQELSVAFQTEDGPRRVVDQISFSIQPQETLALVGESGAGKSVTAHSILRLLPYPNASHPSGRIFFEGKDLLTLPETPLRGIRGNKISMIFQEPMTSLNPLHPVVHQVAEAAMLHQGASKHQAETLALEALDKEQAPCES